MSPSDANMERFSAHTSDGVAGCSRGCVSICDDCVDLELTEAWDAPTVEALTRAGAEPEAQAAPAVSDAPASAHQAQSQIVDRSWLDGRLAEIASSLQLSLQKADPAPALGAFSNRLDNFEARIEAALVRADAREDRDSLRFIEAHVREIDVQFGMMRGQLARIDIIDTRVGEMLDRLPAPAGGIEGLVEGAVSRAIAAASILRDGSSEPSADSSAVLGRIEEALGRLLERVEKIEQGGLVEDPRLDDARLTAAYAEGARVLGLSPSDAMRASARSLHAEDYADARSGAASAQGGDAAASALRSLLDPLEKALGSASVANEPSDADVLLDDFKASALRAKRRAQIAAELSDRDDDDLPSILERPALQAPFPSLAAPRRQDDSAASLQADVRAMGENSEKRPLSKGRWNRGFFVLMLLGGLGFGSAGFMVVDRLIGDASQGARGAAGVPSEPSQPATPVAQAIGNDRSSAATPTALPPAGEVELPGAAARAAALPMAIASPALRNAAANGDPAAEFEIAARYAEGRGVPPNQQEAFAWYHRSAMHGYAPAQFRLASHYEQGAGTEKDIERAKVWYRRAAERGHTKAMHNLGVILAAGGTKVDFASAADWFREAAERNLADSQYNLAVMYESGRGVDVNLAEACKWYALAARSGDLEAERRLKEAQSKLSKSELAAVEKAVATWIPRSGEPAAQQASKP